MPLIRCPVLLLQGDPAVGGMMSDAEIERAKALLCQPDHIFFPNVGHGLTDSVRLLEAIARLAVART